ncbi:Salicylate carboxymethyltransferase, partial [Cucurbita argyrosperma subsp. sororia]
MLAMKGGVGEKSYANNSTFQQKVISMAWPITKEAITQLYCSSYPTSLAIADLGCSSGPNTLILVSNLINQVEKIRHQLHKHPLEYQIFFNDLHTNDFNSLFKSLPSFHQNLETHIGNHDLGPCFFTGVPGSFYGRLFPRSSLHFVFSSYSIHWLSQVPDGLECNKGNIFASHRSPNQALEAYQKQHQKDFSTFLKCRAEELVVGGRMVLISTVRISDDRRMSKEVCYTWELLNLALNSMVAEGVIEEEKVNSFNLPVLTPSLSEVKGIVANEGSFSIDRYEVSKINWNAFDEPCTNIESNIVESSIVVNKECNYAKCMRSVVESLFVRHFGEDIIDELFDRYEQIMKDYMLK